MKKYFTFSTRIFFLAFFICCNNFNGYATAWTTGTVGAVDNLANWTDGTVSPSTFATPGDTWTVNKAMTLGAATWTVGTVSPATPSPVILDVSGSITNSTILTTATIIIHGSVTMSGGSLVLTGGNIINPGPHFIITVNGNFTINNSASAITTGSGIQNNGCMDTLTVNGDLSMTDGTINAGVGTQSQGCNNVITVNGNPTISGGVIGAGCGIQCQTCNNTMTVNGIYTMTGGTIAAANATQAQNCNNTLNVKGNYSTSSTSSMIKNTSGISGFNTVNIGDPTPSGTDLINNTSTGTWTQTTVNILVGCTAQLNGDFATVSGTGLPMIVAGTLICPAAFSINGNGNFTLNSAATIKVAHASGMNGALTTTGTLALNTAANYVFNGAVAQVTGSYLPASLVTPDTITISNSAGVTLSQTTATTGTLLFTSGILHTTASFTMSTPGTSASVIGAGALSYVDGTLIKTISGLSAVNYEVGNVDYAPMNLAIPVPIAGGSLGVLVTHGLHPNVGTSGFFTTSIANHYWTITNIGVTGGGTVIPKGIYNLADIIGGTNTGFETQEYRSAAWLPSPLVSTNTSAPYTTTSNTAIPVATIDGDYIFGSSCIMPITGTSTVCVGLVTALTDASPSGTWSSSNTSIATVDASGNVTGVATGTVTISYSTTCSATMDVTVGTAPIIGAATICLGTSAQLSDATAGGVWSSGISGVATISSTGRVYSVGVGTTVISYAFSTCPVTTSVTVVSLGAITGTTNLCSTTTTALSNATTGGTWSSDNSAVATINPGTGVVYGVTAGTANISYTNGTCTVGIQVTVGTLPITGTASVCIGGTTQLSNATPGGVWSSGTSSVATVDATGKVYGASGGSVTISYTFGSCTPATLVVSVANLSAITPLTPTVCIGSSAQLSDAPGGGVWSSSNSGIATISAGGVVYGAGTGTTTILYSIGSCSTSATVTVNGSISPITGNTSVCVGSTTNLTDATPGGTWSTSNAGIATVAGGTVGGVLAGNASITYSQGGCSVSVSVTVSGPLGAITGNTNVCSGSTTTLSNATGGGVWSSNNTTIASVSSGGVVTGGTAGSTTIVYAVGGCSVNILVTVGNALSAITGTPTTICVGATATLSDATTGGTWSSSNTVIATVSSSGVVDGASAGTADITYSSGGCSVNIAVTIEAPGAGIISGKDSVCPGAAHVVTLSDNVSGGVWSSSNTNKATIDPVTGVVSGVASGTTTIRYVVTTSCGTFTATVVEYVRTAAQCATGVQPMTATQEVVLQVFPNPNTGEFTLDLQSGIDEDMHLVITNIVGEKVKEMTVATNRSVNIKLDQPMGVYLLSASTAHGRYVAKIIVEK